MPDRLFSDVFFAEVERRGLALHALAKEAGIPYDRLKKFGQKHKAGLKPTTSAEDAASLARVLGTTVDSMLLDSQIFALTQPVTDQSDTKAELIDIWDIEASAGDGSVVPHGETVADRLAMPVDYLRSITGTSPRHLQIITVKGRSMLTTLDDGDVIMIDTTKCHLGHDGIYVIRLDDALHIKRIGRSSTRGMVRIISDNQAEYPAFERPMAEIETVGRVIWAGKKM